MAKVSSMFCLKIARYSPIVCHILLNLTSFNSRFPLSPPIVFSETICLMFQIHNLKFIPTVGRRHQRLRPSCLRSRNGSECHVVKRWKNQFPSLPYLNKLPWVKCSHEAAEGAVGKIDERRHIDSEMGNARLIAVLL